MARTSMTTRECGDGEPVALLRSILRESSLVLIHSQCRQSTDDVVAVLAPNFFNSFSLAKLYGKNKYDYSGVRRW